MAEPPTVSDSLRTGAVPRTRGERVLSRRAALRLLAAGAAAGAAGCDRPREELVPYVAVPEHELPGTPLDYATTLGSVHGLGVGVIVTTYTGRPTKIDGNAA
ncbi:MAG TPA: twin-arginine translocation signal domain-containing protein, partial [Gammaproteobacteria bacterium]|nr:twin-arginine translocation signal domain-containing protein [Gammaproteobacteria bacterium]